MDTRELLTMRRVDAFGAAVLRCKGEIDLSVSPELREQLQQLAASPATPELVVLDLRQVVFCDCSGLGAIIGARKRLADAGRQLVLVVNEQGAVRRLLQVTRMDQSLVVRPTLAQAIYRGDR